MPNPQPRRRARPRARARRDAESLLRTIADMPPGDWRPHIFGEESLP